MHTLNLHSCFCRASVAMIGVETTLARAGCKRADRERWRAGLAANEPIAAVVALLTTLRRSKRQPLDADASAKVLAELHEQAAASSLPATKQSAQDAPEDTSSRLGAGEPSGGNSIPAVSIPPAPRVEHGTASGPVGASPRVASSPPRDVRQAEVPEPVETPGSSSVVSSTSASPDTSGSSTGPIAPSDESDDPDLQIVAPVLARPALKHLYAMQSMDEPDLWKIGHTDSLYRRSTEILRKYKVRVKPRILWQGAEPVEGAMHRLLGRYRAEVGCGREFYRLPPNPEVFLQEQVLAAARVSNLELADNQLKRKRIDRTELRLAEETTKQAQAAARGKQADARAREKEAEARAREREAEARARMAECDSTARTAEAAARQKEAETKKAELELEELKLLSALAPDLAQKWLERR